MKTPEIVANHQPAVKEIHVLWTPDGLSCDGDTISITAATLPSVEDLVMGAIPGLPKVHLHNRVLAPTNGSDYMKPWFAAAEGKLDPFVLVVEGSAIRATCPQKKALPPDFFLLFLNRYPRSLGTLCIQTRT
jgi:Ni,Fe-hydrogenase I small subunit